MPALARVSEVVFSAGKFIGGNEGGGAGRPPPPELLAVVSVALEFFEEWRWKIPPNEPNEAAAGGPLRWAETAAGG